MARVFKNPNPYSKQLDQKYTQRVLSVCVALLALTAAFWFTQTKNLYAVIMVLVFALVLFKGIDLIFKRMRRNDRGEDGETEIKEILLKLPDDYAVFQNVPIKKNLDIDLVLVGPIGVYAIEVKSQRRAYNIESCISQTLSETMGLKEYLVKSGINVYVTPVLIFSRAFVKFGFTLQRGVYVIGKKFLNPLLERGRRVEFDRVKAEEAIKKLYLQFLT